MVVVFIEARTDNLVGNSMVWLFLRQSCLEDSAASFWINSALFRNCHDRCSRKPCLPFGPFLFCPSPATSCTKNDHDFWVPRRGLATKSRPGSGGSPCLRVNLEWPWEKCLTSLRFNRPLWHDLLCWGNGG